MVEMTREDFGALAAAYGGRIDRWPADKREAANLLAIADADFARETLETASALDEALDAWSAPAPDMGLRDRLIAAAPPARRRRVSGWAWRAGLGAGLAAACAAGVLVGANLAPDPLGDEAVATAMTSYDLALAEDV